MKYSVRIFLCLLFSWIVLPGIHDALAQNKGNSSDPPFVTELRARGFSILPSPQEVELGKENVTVDGSWALSVNNTVSNDDMAVTRLHQGIHDLHNLSLSTSGDKKIMLSVEPAIVKGTDDSALNQQGYLLRISPESIEITGNTNTGLF